LWEYTQAATVISPILERIIHETGSQQIIDLCSGGSGPIIPLAQQLGERGLTIPILATDKFPDPYTMSELARKTGGRVKGFPESLNATQVPRNLTGLRTLFNSFHHFGPKLARQILQDAYRGRQPIAIFEITNRAPANVALSFPVTFVSVFLLIARMRPFRLSWWLLTWIVPIVPLSISWDALVSHLRSYTEVEFAHLVEAMDQSYSWNVGEVAAPRGLIRISYLVGRPT
jgi:hypothetical protein